MAEQPDNLAPEDALKRVHDVTRKTRRYRSLYAGGLFALGVVTIGWFVIVGIVPSDFLDRYSLAFALIPILVYTAAVRFRHIGGNRRRDVEMERRLMSCYTIGLLISILIAVFLVGNKSWLVAVPAILPMGVCFYGGWWFARHI